MAFGSTVAEGENAVRSTRDWHDLAAVLVRPDGYAAEVWTADEKITTDWMER